MPTTEIDDIFAGKAKGNAFLSPTLAGSSKASKGKAKAEQNPPSSDASKNDKKRKKKKKKKDKVLEDDDDDVVAAATAENGLDKEEKAESFVGPGVKRKRPEPETIIDPSTVLPSKKLKKTEKKMNDFERRRTKTNRKENKEDEARFRDSKGTVPRRKTEEGYGIFKEDELGINPEAGDTPLCPFDCDCCF